MASPPSTRGDHLTFTTSTSSANTPPFTSHSPNTSTNSRISHNLSDMLFGKPTTSGTSLSTSANESTPLLAEPPCHGGRTPRRNLTASLDQVAEAAAQNRVVKLNKISPISSESEEGEAGDGRLSRDRASITMAYAKKIKQRSKYYVPVTDWLPKYSWSLFSGDLVAGEKAMSYASGLARLTPVAGLWSTAIPALIYGALGTCRQLSIGPEAALSLLIGQMIQEAVYGDPHSRPAHPEAEAAAIALITTLQIGVITSVLGLLRLGFLDVVLSRALLRGFITAVAVIIFIEQLVPMLGLAALLAQPTDPSKEPPTRPLSKLFFTINNIHSINVPTALLSFTSLGFLIIVRVIKQKITQRPGGNWVRYVPEILILVVGTTILTNVLKWDEKGVEVLGKIKGGSSLPFGWPIYKKTMKYFNYTLPTAFVSAVVGVVDSIVAARENASMYGYDVSPNRELVALGASNLVGSSIVGTGAIPVFGSITRSRLNGQIGSRTQMASIITSICMIFSIFFLLPYLYYLPKAVLAAIVTVVVYAILNEAPHEILYFWRMGAWTDFLQMVGTFFLTLCFSIELGLVASVVFSLILVIQSTSQPRIKIIGRVPGTNEWVPIDEDESAQEEIPGVLVVRIRESLSFANTGQLKERLRRLELYGMGKSHPSDEPRRESAKALILHMGDVEHIDASATQILYELTKAYHERGVGVHFAHLRPGQMKAFGIAGITDIVGPSHFHQDLSSAMREVESMGYGTSIFARWDAS
ncbi:endoplasmic reticulum protein [Cryptococcus deuterogattii LA55]|nr:endoplasmic reticulum protein [Cryptococcus deuterogattii LA55]KIR32507.1 endoplasmic reticulum protein [Cryptococcus deuterogattii MMRL2647]KIR70775.1 endoplasmic reticulum protein [Cryptococcus deuterogattii CA1014]KIR90646.1 endoplasmic reticulum protein [Cryptococcus deuterogattii CBS 10090]KIR97614.1 endoplasmic reticulum protein [Cryptococcus deuterogattii 2001/935-1]